MRRRIRVKILAPIHDQEKCYILLLSNKSLVLAWNELKAKHFRPFFKASRHTLFVQVFLLGENAFIIGLAGFY